jgi:arylsulfatase A-like enzyme
VRTTTHKLIYFWKKDQWEMYDLVKDPDELHNLYNDPAQKAGPSRNSRLSFTASRKRSGTTTSTPTSSLRNT